MGRLKKYQGSQILLQISGGFWKVGDYSIFSKVANLARLKKKNRLSFSPILRDYRCYDFLRFIYHKKGAGDVILQSRDTKHNYKDPPEFWISYFTKVFLCSYFKRNKV